MATLYFTSSRGGWVAAAIAIVVLMALTSRRWATAGALLIGGAASAGSVAVLLSRDELVDSPLTSSVAESQGRSAALLIALLCAVAGAAYGLLAVVVPTPPRASRAASTAFAAVLVLISLAAVVAVHPVRRYEHFKEIPPELTGASVQEHLFSSSGNGRWQWWSSAADEWQTRPFVGRGAGSYEAWWAEHASIPAFVRDAHSLYLETLGELGLVGLALLVAFLVRASSPERDASATGVKANAPRSRRSWPSSPFVFEAGIDWMWELTAVSAVAMFALGLLTGPATEPAVSGLQAVETRRRVSPVIRIAVAAVAFGLIVAETIPLLANMEVRKSQDSVNSGDLVQALDQAESARSIQPWAAIPYLQLALVQELGGQIDEAHASIEHALENDQSDWRLWLVAARIQTKAGDIAAARAEPRQGARAVPEVATLRGLIRSK